MRLSEPLANSTVTHRRSVAIVSLFALIAILGSVLVAKAVTGPLGGDAAPTPKGCSASNIDYYYDPSSGQYDWEKAAELDWIPVSARDSAAIIGCAPANLIDPTSDDAAALLDYGEGDYDVPVPVFAFDGQLVAYIVVYKGAVDVEDALRAGDIPERLVEDPPKSSDFGQFFSDER